MILILAPRGRPPQNKITPNASMVVSCVALPEMGRQTSSLGKSKEDSIIMVLAHKGKDTSE